MASPDPSRLGKYRVLDLVATGPVTEVYKARLDGIAGFSRLYAIKRVRPEVAEHADAVARVEEQARLAATLTHGNIVQVLDLGQEDGRLYLVLEWIEGWSLAEILPAARAADAHMPAAHAAWIGVHLLKALDYAHDAARGGMAHGAVCPVNVLVSRSGEVKLSDFGLAHAAALVSEQLPQLVPPRLDRACPEALHGQALSPAVDLFGVARLLYACLALRDPFDAADPAAVRDRIREGAYEPLDGLRDDIPAGLADVIHAGLSADPSKRPASAGVMQEALAEVLRGTPDVFTQEVLASWVRPLFGTPDPVDEPATLEVGDGDLGELGADDQIDLPPLPEREEVTENQPMRPAVAPDDVYDEDFEEVEAKTLVNAAPASLAPPAPTWNEGGETAINPDVAARVAELRKQRDASDQLTRVRAAALADLELPEAPASRSLWVGGALVALLMLGVGAGLGAVGMLVWGRDAGLMVHRPMLEVRTTPNVPMTVSVDGVALDGPSPLEPGRHAVRIDIAGAAPWDMDLTLEAGEYRLMIVEAAQLPAVPEDGSVTPQ